MKKYFILFLLTMHLTSCSNKETNIVKESKPNIPKQLKQATLTYLDTLFEDGTSVTLKFTMRLDSSLFSTLNTWTSYNEAKIDKDDKSLFVKLTQINFDSLYLSTGDTSFVKGQKKEDNPVLINFGGLSFNKDTTKIATVLAVLFGKEIKSGWQEVIVFVNGDKGWTIMKRNIILEY